MKKFCISFCSFIICSNLTFASCICFQKEWSFFYDKNEHFNFKQPICAQYLDKSSQNTKYVSLGYYGNYIFNRNIKSIFNKSMYLEKNNELFSSEDIADAKFYLNSAIASVKIYDNLDIFGTIGYTTSSINSFCTMFNYQFEDDPNSSFTINHSSKMKSNNPINILFINYFRKSAYKDSLNLKNIPSYSLGLKWDIFKHKDFKMSSEIKYSMFKTNQYYINSSVIKMRHTKTKNNKELIIISDIKPHSTIYNSIFFQELNLGCEISYKIKKYIPYAGIKFSSFNFYSTKPIIQAYAFLDLPKEKISEVKTVLGSFNYKNRSKICKFVGLNIIHFNTVLIGLESRFGDDIAISATARIQF